MYKYKCERGNEYRDMDRHEVGDIGVFSVWLMPEAYRGRQ